MIPIILSLQAQEQTVVPRMSRVALQRKEEASGKAINDALLSRLRPYRSASNAAALVSLGGSGGGSESQSTRKDDSKSHGQFRLPRQVVSYCWLSARLQYLQCISNGDTAVLH